MNLQTVRVKCRFLREVSPAALQACARDRPHDLAASQVQRSKLVEVHLEARSRHLC